MFVQKIVVFVCMCVWGLLVWVCACARLCVCACVWAIACFTLMPYKDIIILLNAFSKSNVFHKPTYRLHISMYCSKLHFRIMRKNSHFMKSVTGVGKQNTQLLCKLKEEILTEYVLLL